MEIFRPDSPVVRTNSKCLPHWSQSGAVTFITWRTADSIPKEVLNHWRIEREIWLRENGIRPSDRESQSSIVRVLDESQKKEYHRRFSRAWNQRLDECHGECLLRNRSVSQIVKESLLYRTGGSYEVDSFIIMPNHVHVLASFETSGKMLSQVAAWKRFTARRINEMTGRSGAFWQPDCFDHLVRTRRQWDAISEYIRQNPEKARLQAGEYCYWERTDG